MTPDREDRATHQSPQTKMLSGVEFQLKLPFLTPSSRGERLHQVGKEILLTSRMTPRSLDDCCDREDRVTH